MSDDEPPQRGRVGIGHHDAANWRAIRPRIAPLEAAGRGMKPQHSVRLDAGAAIAEPHRARRHAVAGNHMDAARRCNFLLIVENDAAAIQWPRVKRKNAKDKGEQRRCNFHCDQFGLIGTTAFVAVVAAFAFCHAVTDDTQAAF